eukprot:s60_g9.t1
MGEEEIMRRWAWVKLVAGRRWVKVSSAGPGQVGQAAPGLGEVGCRSALGRAACGLSCEPFGPTLPPALGCPDRVMGLRYCSGHSC